MQVYIKNRSIIIMTALILGYALTLNKAYSATLSIESGNEYTGTQIEVNVSLNPSTQESVSACQFDVLYDTTVYEIISVVTGDSSLAAQKQVQYNTVTSGQIRVIIAGLNQNIIPSGSVAKLNVKVCSSAPAGTYELSLNRVILSNPIGTSVPATPVNGIMTIQRSSYHSADQNHDWKFSLTEILRVIQLYNSGSYSCSCGTEDGYDLTGENRDCVPHNSDYYGTSNWRIQLYELLRLIQIYNYGSYHSATGTEDGFALGLS